MIYSPETAEKTASLLLQIKAIKINSREPFTWSSGWKSPVYCDNRLILSFPEIRTYVKENLAIIIRERFTDVDLLAGVATAGIAHGALAADVLGAPFSYVRSSPKEHGLKNRIEGLVVEGQKAVVVEDLISTGGSSLSVVSALRDAGLHVNGLVAIFSYGFPVAEKQFTEMKCPYFTLTDYSFLVKEALKQNLISESELPALEEWRRAPENWKGRNPVA